MQLHCSVKLIHLFRQKLLFSQEINVCLLSHLGQKKQILVKKHF